MALQLELTTTKAQTELRAAEATIKQLEAALNGLGNVRGLQELTRQLAGVRGIDTSVMASLTQLATAMQQLGNAAGNTRGVATELNKLGRVDMSKVAANVNQLSTALGNLRVPPSLGRTVVELGLLRSALQNAVSPANALSSAMANIKTPQINVSGLSGVSGQFGAAATGARSFGGALSSVTPLLAGFGVALGAQNFGQFISGALSTVNTVETLKASLQAIETQYGSTEKAATAGGEGMDFIRKVAAETRVPIESMVKTFPNLNAAMRATGKEGADVEAVFRNMSIAGRVLNLSGDDMKGIFRALQQSFSKGAVQAEELKGQIGERIPGAVNVMAEAMGVGTQELFKMMEQGKVSSDNLIKFAQRLAEIYGSGLPTALAKPGAAIAALGNSFFELQLSFGLAFWGQAASAVEKLIASMSDGGGVSALTSSLGTVAGVITNVLVNALVIGAEYGTQFGIALGILVGPSVVTGLISASTAIYAMGSALVVASFNAYATAGALALVQARAVGTAIGTAAMWAFSFATGAAAGAAGLLAGGVLSASIGIVAIAAVVALAAAAFYVWYNNLDVLSGLINAYPETMAALASAFTQAGEIISQMWTGITDAAGVVFEYLSAGWARVVEAFNYVGTAAQNLFNYFFQVQNGGQAAAQGMNEAEAAAARTVGSVGGAANASLEAATGFNKAGDEAQGAQGGLNAASGAASALSGSFNSSVGAANSAAAAYRNAAAAAREFASAKASAGAPGGGGGGGGDTTTDEFRVGGVSGEGTRQTSFRADAFRAAPSFASGTPDTSSVSHLAGTGGGIPSVLHPNEAVIPLQDGNVPVAISGGGGGVIDMKILEATSGVKDEVARVWDAVDIQTRLMEGWFKSANTSLDIISDTLLSTQADLGLYSTRLLDKITASTDRLYERIGTGGGGSGGGSSSGGSSGGGSGGSSSGGSSGGGSGGGGNTSYDSLLSTLTSAASTINSAAQQQGSLAATTQTVAYGTGNEIITSPQDVARLNELAQQQRSARDEAIFAIQQMFPNAVVKNSAFGGMSHNQVQSGASALRVDLTKLPPDFRSKLSPSVVQALSGTPNNNSFAAGIANTSSVAGRSVRDGRGGFGAVLHPDEAVIPLPNGKHVPVQLTMRQPPTGMSGGKSAPNYGPRGPNFGGGGASRPPFSTDPMHFQSQFRDGPPSFHPAGGGAVARGGRSGANGAATIIMNIHTNDANSFKASENQVLREFAGRINQVNRRVGAKRVVDDPTKRPE